MELLSDLHRSGATICMVTDDPRFARRADRPIQLFDGQVDDEESRAAHLADARGVEVRRTESSEIGRCQTTCATRFGC
jgi:ABC-type lipoprotein export system ATPase subunit